MAVAVVVVVVGIQTFRPDGIEREFRCCLGPSRVSNAQTRDPCRGSGREKGQRDPCDRGLLICPGMENEREQL